MSETLQERLRALNDVVTDDRCSPEGIGMRLRVEWPTLYPALSAMEAELADARAAAAINFEQASGWRDNANAAQARIKELEALLRQFKDWIKKVKHEDADGGSYLNGDSDTYPGEGWDDLDEIDQEVDAALSKAEAMPSATAIDNNPGGDAVRVPTVFGTVPAEARSPACPEGWPHERFGALNETDDYIDRFARKTISRLYGEDEAGDRPARTAVVAGAIIESIYEYRIRLSATAPKPPGEG